MMIIYGCCRYIIMMGVTMQLKTSTPLRITPLKLHVTLGVFFRIMRSVPFTKLVEVVPRFMKGGRILGQHAYPASSRQNRTIKYLQTGMDSS
jgi:hypothetical protein